MVTIEISNNSMRELFRTYDDNFWAPPDEVLFVWEDPEGDLNQFYKWFAESFDASVHRRRLAWDHETRTQWTQRYVFIGRFRTAEEAMLFKLRWS